ncbi:MAG: FtsX-like permease family protein [Desulfobulbaceae bacterium]|nr:FtsX-like permease family protein [Desulfobulbaceae bacterium]
MNILTIPLRNTWRKPSRTVLLLMVFTLGVMSIVALYQVSLVIGTSMEKKLSTYGANILVLPGNETLSVGYGGFHLGDMLYDVQPLSEKTSVAAVRSIGHSDRISAVAPKLVTTTRINGTAVAVVGVRWEDELPIKSYWATDGAFPSSPDEVVVGSKAAANLGISAGDTIYLMEHPFRISAVLYPTGGDDDNVILADLGTVQRVTNRPDEVSFLEVAALCSGCPIDDIVAQMRGNLPNTEIKALSNVVNQRMASIHFVQRLVLSISLVILVTAATMVGLSMLSAVNERKKDIGLLRSLGYSKGRIFFIFCLEAGIIGILSGTLGYFSGFAASFKALSLLAMAEGARPVFDLNHLLLTCAVISIVTVAAASYPAWKGARIEPSQALLAI